MARENQTFLAARSIGAFVIVFIDILFHSRWKTALTPLLFPLSGRPLRFGAELDHTLGGGGFVRLRESQRDNNGPNVREAKAESSSPADRGLSPWRPGWGLCCRLHIKIRTVVPCLDETVSESTG